MRVSRKENIMNEPSPVMEHSLIEQMMAIEPDKDIVSCEYCLHHTHAANADNRHCKLSYCPYIAERMPFGQVTYRDAILATAFEVTDKRFTTRAVKMVSNPTKDKVRFMDETHKKLFYQTKLRLGIANKSMETQIYLLTADKNLWQQIQKYVSKHYVDFEHFKPVKFSETAYTLFCMARDLFLNTDFVDMGDLADIHLINAQLFMVICNALTIERFGDEILKLA